MIVSGWFFFCAAGVCFAVVRAVVRDGMETVDATEGASVTLRTDLTSKKTGDVILWTFGTTDTIIAQLVNRDSVTLCEEKFGNRLQMDVQTGSLTISNISIADSGVYKVQIISVEISNKHFTVSVYAPVPIPSIKNLSEIRECQTPEDQSMQLRSTPIRTDRGFTSGHCSVLCSVTNGPQVSLSWTTGRHALKQTNSSNLSVPLCLRLEIHIQDLYSCVAANPVSHQSTQLNITQFCPHTGLSRVHCCGPVELVVRLVLSTVVGLATIVILIHHSISRVQHRPHLSLVL